MGEIRLRHRLVVASPTLDDPNFRRTVVFILEHGEDGSLGVVLNRPSRAPVAAAIPGDWGGLAADPPVVFLGGPVQQQAAMALARVPAGQAPEGWRPIVGRVGTVDLSADADRVRAQLSDMRVFAGHAGWAAGQLEGEVAAGAWFVVDPLPQDPFSSDPSGLWRGVLVRQGGLYTTFPADPSLN